MKNMKNLVSVWSTPSCSLSYRCFPAFLCLCLSFSLSLSLTQHGACVNAMDLWQFTPLHEAASKNRTEVCSLLLSYGANPTFLNCHNKSAIDLALTSQLKERLGCKLDT